MRISDWSSDVCSSDLRAADAQDLRLFPLLLDPRADRRADHRQCLSARRRNEHRPSDARCRRGRPISGEGARSDADRLPDRDHPDHLRLGTDLGLDPPGVVRRRSEEHTSELQSLMRISYAVFCLKKKQNKTITEFYITKTMRH